MVRTGTGTNVPESWSLILTPRRRPCINDLTPRVIGRLGNHGPRFVGESRPSQGEDLRPSDRGPLSRPAWRAARPAPRFPARETCAERAGPPSPSRSDEHREGQQHPCARGGRLHMGGPGLGARRTCVGRTGRPRRHPGRDAVGPRDRGGIGRPDGLTDPAPGLGAAVMGHAGSRHPPTGAP